MSLFRLICILAFANAVISNSVMLNCLRTLVVSCPTRFSSGAERLAIARARISQDFDFQLREPHPQVVATGTEVVTEVTTTGAPELTAWRSQGGGDCERSTVASDDGVEEEVGDEAEGTTTDESAASTTNDAYRRQSELPSGDASSPARPSWR